MLEATFPVEVLDALSAAETATRMALVVEFYRCPRDELVAVRFDGRSELVPIDSLVVETPALPEERLAPG